MQRSDDSPIELNDQPAEDGAATETSGQAEDGSRQDGVQRELADQRE